MAVCAVAVSMGMPTAAAAQRLPDSELLAFNERYQRQAHNAYEKEWAAALDRGIFNVEIDIRNHNPYNGLQDWKVRHTAHGGDKNRCGGGDRSFAVCLRDLRRWHDDHPGHYPITVVIDKKDGWQADKARAPSDFDQRLDREIGRENIFAPGDLLRGAGSLRDAVTRHGWPAITSLRGKFVLLMTPHENWAESRSSANDKAHDYVRDRGAAAFAFVCPRGHASEIRGQVAGFSGTTSRSVVCFNHKEDQIAGDGGYRDGRALQAAGYVLRVWSVDSESEYRNAVDNSLATFVALDEPARFGHFLGGRPEGGHSMRFLAPITAAFDLTTLADTAGNPLHLLLPALLLPLE